VGSEGTVLALTRSGSGSAGSVSRTMGTRCGAAGVSDNGVDGCGSRSGVDDDIDVALAGGVARGVKFAVKRLAGGRETRSTGSIAKGFSDDVVTVLEVIKLKQLHRQGRRKGKRKMMERKKQKGTKYPQSRPRAL
jgi:hypothetical protein